MNKSNQKLNNKKNISSHRQGFTLVEVVVAMGVFVMVMAGAAGAFASAFKSYRGAKNINENVKNAQYAINLMSKTFRTSTLKDYAASNRVVVYDHSQSLCIRYVFTGTDLTKATASIPEFSCNNGSPSFSAAMNMTTGIVQGRFNAIDSEGDISVPSSERVGIITVTMNITNSGGGSSSSAQIQSTSSLRDYTVSNVGIDPNNAP